MSSLGVFWPNSTPLVRKIFFATVAAALAFFNRRRLLWPGSGPDKSFPNTPLPPSTMGCPFVGRNLLGVSELRGPMYVILDAFKKVGRQKLVTMYSFFIPIIAVSGQNTIKKVLEREFDPEGANTVLVGDGFKRVFGNKSILYETDKSTHSLLRKLVGTSMTPTELSRAVPSIQAAANSQVDKMLQGSSVEGNSSIVEMESVCNAFTLDVAWRQILGLDLKNQKEIDEFHMYTKQWLDGLTDPRLMLPFLPGARFIKPVLAKKYLLEKVEQRLSTLDELGTSDGSSLGAIYFATDNDNGVRLTREQVIDNALILIVAGSETSASTLTMAISLLGRHKDVWTKIKDEQAAVISKFGTNLSKDILDHEMPYLEAVIKETLRLAPVPAMEFRKMGKTSVIDGKQIPKNYFVASSIRSTHEEDPATYMADGSHMDPIRGFKPQRWLSDGSGADEGLQIPSEWMPWGIGLRRCVGERLAMTEMKTFLATLARRVDFDLPADEDERVFKFKSKTFMAKPKDKAKIIPRSAPLIPSTTQS